MAKKPKIRKHPVTMALPVDLLDMLDEFCRDKRIPKVQVCELALRRFLTVENGEHDAAEA